MFTFIECTATVVVEPHDESKDQNLPKDRVLMTTTVMVTYTLAKETWKVLPFCVASTSSGLHTRMSVCLRSLHCWQFTSAQIGPYARLLYWGLPCRDNTTDLHWCRRYHCFHFRATDPCALTVAQNIPVGHRPCFLCGSLMHIEDVNEDGSII